MIQDIIRVITLDPQWIIVILTFLAILVALFGLDILSWRNRPKIRFALSNYPPYVIQTFNSQKFMIKYFRIKVINMGKTVAKNCHIKLISASSTGKERILPLIEPDKLKWSNAPLDSRYSIRREKLDISPHGGWEFCDLFRLESTGMDKIRFMSSGERDVPINDNYIIKIEISGDNLRPRKATIKTTNKNWETKIEWD